MGAAQYDWRNPLRNNPLVPRSRVRVSKPEYVVRREQAYSPRDEVGMGRGSEWGTYAHVCKHGADKDAATRRFPL